ncbi:MAG TPA: HD domain-containing phosphohydrolase [Syntrophales bacterium]|nr:HD domain-containing phosphohydrolase [Syntrophales bacterium]
MRFFSFEGLRVKLISLVLVTMLPVFGLIILADMRERDHMRNHALHDALNVAKQVAQSESNVIEGERHTLFLLSQMLKVHDLRSETLEGVLKLTLQESPAVAGLIVAEPNGNVIANTYHSNKKLNISDLPSFQRLMQAKNFVVGEYQISRITGKSMLTLRHPVFDETGRVKKIISAGLDLGRLSQRVIVSGLPSGTHLSIVDHNGTVLFRYPEPAAYVGKSMLHKDIMKKAFSKKEGVIETIGLDEVPRLYGFTSYGQPAGTVYVIVGIPTKEAFADVNRKTLHRLIWLTCVTAMALVMSWFFGNIFILRPLNRLLLAAKQIESGDITARAGVSSGKGEIAQLSQAFDHMGEALQKRDAERQKAEEAMRENEKQIQLHLNRITALHEIDMAITGSLDMRVTLNVILNQVTSQLNVDAAVVLLLDEPSLFLSYAAGKGFHTSALQHTRLRIGEGLAGRAALERRNIGGNIADEAGCLEQSPLLEKEEFQTHYAVPLIAKGHVKGVLEVFHRTPLTPNREWLDFLDTLATQAAISVDSAELFNDLEHSNIELRMAYDTTLEGWSRALDLRDKETEGHSRRVTELTMRLAEALGLSKDKIAHLRRGALLHDIGKMAVPDSILLKPGPLTEAEWVLMRKHPIYAHELLQPIKFLLPALEIPYCHHEKWDGTGYPRGLQGDGIPIGGRIFAVVDVWDALISDRPYRPAWQREKVIDYMKEQAGRHFDPDVVRAFINLVKEGVT